jgi:hypothetical protein
MSQIQIIFQIIKSELAPIGQSFYSSKTSGYYLVSNLDV